MRIQLNSQKFAYYECEAAVQNMFEKYPGLETYLNNFKHGYETFVNLNVEKRFKETGNEMLKNEMNKMFYIIEVPEDKFGDFIINIINITKNNVVIYNNDDGWNEKSFGKKIYDYDVTIYDDYIE